MFILNKEILQKIAPKLSLNDCERFSILINEICPLYGINSSNILHEFLANVLHESNEFLCKEENLKYSATRLMQVWPTRFSSLSVANKYANNDKLLAEKVYGNRKDLGNIQPGDGWRFRGSGFIQMTGRINFISFSSYMRKEFNLIKPIDVLADMIRNEDQYAMHSACFIFSISMKLIDAAVSNNMLFVIKRINGGYIGMEDRMKYYDLCKKYILDN